MKYNRIRMNENDLIENFTKEQLEEILKLQIEQENYEGATVVKNAIDQYDECTTIVFEEDVDSEEDDNKNEN